MANEYCTDCKAYTPRVHENNAGDTICTVCGLVLQSHSIDETSEWKQFGNEVFGNLNTFNGNKQKKTDTIEGVGIKPRTIDSKEDCHLLKAFKAMDEIADRLGLLQIVKDCAKEIFKKSYEDEKLVRYWKGHIATKVACLYLACKEHDSPRTIKEIRAAAGGVKVKDIPKALKVLKNYYNLAVGRDSIHPYDISRRYCSKLGLKCDDTKAVQEILEKAKDCDIRGNPNSIVAAVIYTVTQLSDKTITLSQIAQASEMSDATLKKAYKELYPRTSVLIPSWFANAEEIKGLHNFRRSFSSCRN
ncbi:hypothetical protein RIF29_14381 [Crotalaria pallida]|uniref:TFIIB-type domain-containing protein n=1 Tax=Crotalaria pallida TaxID=3830 RepID=A0AAN9FBE6_CROPI